MMSRLPKQKALELLNKQYNEIESLKVRRFGNPEFRKWRDKTIMIISNIFSEDSSHYKEFKAIRYSLTTLIIGKMIPDSDLQKVYVDGLNRAEAKLETMITDVQTFWDDNLADQNYDKEPLLQIERILERFHLIVRQLELRHENRPTLNIRDEYDVQDLLHALLRLHFDDIRPEEWTPSYASGSSRMDFILNEHDIVIEVKKTSARTKTQNLANELIIDINRYKAHSKLKVLICFIYDPEGRISNPRGVEQDLSKKTDGIYVKCFIRPK